MAAPTHSGSYQEMIRVGTIEQLNRYPVKSMRAETLDEAEVGYRGIKGDRRYAFIQGDDHSNFPWLTAREIPLMLQYRAALVDPSDPDNSGVLVTTPEGIQHDIFSDELIEDLRSRLKGRHQNQPIYALHLKSAHDDDNLSVITTYALRKLSARIGEEVDRRRFRQNLIVNTDGSSTPHEQDWVGRRIVVGEGDRAPVIAITRGDQRCMMPNLHPDTSVQDPRILRTIAQEQNNVMGVYASVVRSGTIRVGDPVYLLADASQA